MDTNLLRSWLHLAPGPWPPDDRSLLGLTENDPDSLAERRAMERMARLRQHQLLHPDLVTEGMNRIAQALLTVGSAQRTSPKPTSEQGPAPFYPEVDLQGIVVDQAEFEAATREPDAQTPEVVEAEAVAVARDPETDRLKRFTELEARRKKSGGLQFFESAGKVALAPAVVGKSHQERREAYRELADLRRITRLWDRLQPFFADPTESLASPGSIYDFLESSDAARFRLTKPDAASELVIDHAPNVVTILRLSPILPVFRMLGIEQRRHLAREWSTARAVLELRREGLRGAVVRAALRAKNDAPEVSLSKWLGRNPEWILGLISGAVLLAALAKAVIRRG